MTSYSDQYKLHGKEGHLIIPPSKSMVIGWQSGEAALSASISASEGKTYNQKPPPQSTHYGFPTLVGLALTGPITQIQSLVKGSWTIFGLRRAGFLQ